MVKWGVAFAFDLWDFVWRRFDNCTFHLNLALTLLAPLPLEIEVDTRNRQVHIDLPVAHLASVEVVHVLEAVREDVPPPVALDLHLLHLVVQCVLVQVAVE